MIPGVYLKLIDCGTHHKDPRSFITLRKSKDGFLPEIPHVKENRARLSYTLVPLSVNIKNRGLQNEVNELNPNGTAFMINLTNGDVYECAFSTNHFIKWLDEQQDCENYASVMHWAVSHLQNQQFAEQIIRSLYSKNLFCMGSDVLKEYLLANSYWSCKHNQEFHKDFLCLLRMSTIEVCCAQIISRVLINF